MNVRQVILHFIKLSFPAVIRDQLHLAEAGTYRKFNTLYFFCVHGKQGSPKVSLQEPGSYEIFA